jgi:hypothetical protein
VGRVGFLRGPVPLFGGLSGLFAVLPLRAGIATSKGRPVADTEDISSTRRVVR